MGNKNLLTFYNQLNQLLAEGIREIELELKYYHASVYKQETAERIKQKIKELCHVLEATRIRDLIEPVLDYQSELKSADKQPAPGESPFVNRVFRFTQGLKKELRKRVEQTAHHKRSQFYDLKNFKPCKKSILALCKLGDENWSFFSKTLK